MSIDAAIQGAGVALGRSVLVAEDLAAGRLVSLFPQARLDVEWGYDLLYRAGNRDHPKVALFRDWIASEVRVVQPKPGTNHFTD
jgi:LysR family glycine cleavage system transcriptional activator